MFNYIFKKKVKIKLKTAQITLLTNCNSISELLNLL